MTDPSANLNTVDVEKVRNYLAKHEIHILFEQLAAEVVQQQPEDPILFLHDALGKRLAPRSGTTAPPTLPAPS